MDERTAQASELMKAWQERTRGGFECQIYAVYPDQEWALIGAVKIPRGGWEPQAWRSDGSWRTHKATSGFDLLKSLLPEDQQ